MIKLTSLVFLFLISLASTAQLPNTIFNNNPNQSRKITSSNLRTAENKQHLDSIIISSSTKYVYTYDATGNLILEIGYSRPTASNSWNVDTRDEYGYDAAGNTILHIYYGWNDLRNIFVKTNKYERLYDVNKNMTSEIIYDWDIDNAIWVEKYKSENTFGSNGQISKKDNYYWNASVWGEDGYIDYTYNSENLLVKKAIYVRFNLLSYTTTYTYDTDDKVSSEITANYGGNPNMYSGSKYEYTYDNSGNVILLLESEWSIGTEDWEKNLKVEYTFDLQNNNTETLYFYWNKQTKEWEQSYKFSYTYDNTYSITDLIMPVLIPVELNGISNHKLTSIKYNVLKAGWENEVQYDLYYNDGIITSIGYASLNALLVYPNPAKDIVMFTNKTNDAATLELFNQQGSLVYNNTIIMNQPVSVEGMVQGIYFYRISNTNAGSYNGTLIINE